jgi:hypothetical protein
MSIIAIQGEQAIREISGLRSIIRNCVNYKASCSVYFHLSDMQKVLRARSTTKFD